MIKDHRFDVTTSNVQKFLGGEMKSFLDELMLKKMYKGYSIHFGICCRFEQFHNIDFE